MEQNPTGQKCGCPHHKMVPVFLVLFGLVFLLGAVDVFSAKVVNTLWPIIVILAGLTKISEHRCKCCDRM